MKSKKWLQNTFVVCIIASICCGLWGSAFPCVKIGFQMLQITSGAINSQILFAGTRFTLAGVLSIIIGSVLSKHILIPRAGTWPKILILSIFQTILQYLFFYIGLSHTTGVKASIVQGMNVFVALLVSSLIFHQEKLSRQKIIGCCIGFVGVVLINFNTNGLSTEIHFLGEGFIFLSTVTYAVSSVILKQYSKTESTILLSGYQFVVGGFIMMLIGFLTGGKVEHYNANSLAILFYLALVSAVAYALWGVLLKHNPISKVAVYGFMTPILGVILSAVLLNEKQLIGQRSILALLLVSVGIYVVNYPAKSKQKEGLGNADLIREKGLRNN